jgi:hypothetical protein
VSSAPLIVLKVLFQYQRSFSLAISKRFVLSNDVPAAVFNVLLRDQISAFLPDKADLGISHQFTMLMSSRGAFSDNVTAWLRAMT